MFWDKSAEGLTECSDLSPGFDGVLKSAVHELVPHASLLMVALFIFILGLWVYLWFAIVESVFIGPVGHIEFLKSIYNPYSNCGYYTH
jgi:hypothetical protein